MVYESGFTTRRTYSSRPVTTSYAVTYPSVHNVTRVYKTSYPIYSSYSIPRRVVSGPRVITSPVRVVTSPTRVFSRVVHSPSPVRVVRTTTRITTSPERTSSYSYTSPTTYYSPSTYLPSTYYTSSYIPTSYTTYTPSYHYNPTTVTRVYARSASPGSLRVTTSPIRVTPSYLKRLPPGYGARALTNYLNTEPFTTFSEETSRIRNRAQSLIRDLHTPVVRRARSCTPFPVTGYSYGPTSQLALDAYVARVTNPVRHIAKEVHNISHYPKPAVKYVGKSHLASVRICGDRAYNIRSPMYDSDKVRTDINLLSWYLRHPTWKNEKKNVTHQEDAELDPNRPSRKFSAPRPLEDAVDLESKEKQRLRQERLMTVNEDALDEIENEKKQAKLADEAKRQKESALKEKKQREEAERALHEEQARLAAEAKQAAEEARKAKEAQQAKAEAEAQKAAQEEAKAAEDAAARKAEEERLAEEARIAEELRLAEEAAQQAAAEAKAAEEAKAAAAAAEAEAAALKAEEEARLAEEAEKAAEEAAARKAEEDRLAEEMRLEEEQRLVEQELNRLAEIEKQAAEEREGELASQAAELAEIARQEAQIVAQELQSIQKESRDVAEPIIDEPSSPVEDIQGEPTIELNSNVEDVSAELENTAGECCVEDDDDEEEE